MEFTNDILGVLHHRIDQAFATRLQDIETELLGNLSLTETQFRAWQTAYQELEMFKENLIPTIFKDFRKEDVFDVE